MKRPAFWICLGLLSLGAAVIGARYFPDAFSIVSLDITMDRERALADARAIAERHGLGPPGFQEAASFTLDSETQTFVELEAGGKDAFTQMMRDRLYSAYTWRVRHFKEGEANETLIRFTPDGTPYGFVERLKEDAPGRDTRGWRGPAAGRERGSLRLAGGLEPVRPRRARAGTKAGRAGRSHDHLRARLADARRRALSAPSRGGRRSPDGGHALRPDPAGIHPALREHAIRERGDRHRRGRGHGPDLRDHRHRRRPLLHAPRPMGALAARGVVGRVHRISSGARGHQRVAAVVDDVRHGIAALDVPRAANRDHHRLFRRICRVLRAVVHRRRNADPSRVRRPSPVLASLGQRTGELDRDTRKNRRRVFDGLGVLRVRSCALHLRDQEARMVDTVRGVDSSRRAGHVRAVVVGHRQLAASRLLGRELVPRGADRRRRVDRQAWDNGGFSSCSRSCCRR